MKRNLLYLLRTLIVVCLWVAAGIIAKGYDLISHPEWWMVYGYWVGSAAFWISERLIGIDDE